MAVGYLTSSTLIAAVQREGMIPSNQSTFTKDDFLAIANQEMKIGILPAIMQYHEEYYVRDSLPVPIQPNQRSYSIPYRAMGGKLRDVSYLGLDGILHPMAKVSPEDRAFYHNYGFINFSQYKIKFYIQGNDLVLIGDVGPDPIGSLVFSYYIRPNDLVDELRVATIQNISTTSLSGTISAISTGTTAIITSVGHGLTTGNIVTFSNTNSVPSIDGQKSIFVISSDTFSINSNITIAGTSGTFSYNATTYAVDQIPTGFSTSAKLDLLQTLPGHKTINFDLSPILVDSVNSLITFNSSDCTTRPPIVGDYVAFAGECIIPQAPTDLHGMLVQRIISRVMQALGDAAGLAAAENTLVKMSVATSILTTNRDEASPIKIFNRNGLLRGSRF